MVFSYFKLFIWLSLICVCVVSYNLDVETAIVFEDPSRNSSNKTRGSYFGFTVVLLNGTSSGSWLFVGAPRANSTFHKHKGIVEPGVLYKCHVTPSRQNQTCEQYLLDNTGNQKSPYGFPNEYYDQKDGGWVGAAMDVHSFGDDAEFTVCGPRWTSRQKQDKYYYYLMLGICYVVSGKDIEKCKNCSGGVKYLMVPSTKSANMVYGKIKYYKLAETGMSVHYAEPQQGTVLVAGAPGILNWQGGVMFTKRKILKNTVPQQRRRRDTSWTYDEKRYNATFIFQKDNKVEPNDYIGYQVTSGNFFHNLYSYAASSPRGDDLKGNVQLFSVEPKDIVQITKSAKVGGSQVGEYFGASIAVADVNGDHCQDLIVGAPMYHKLCEEGRIYIYLGGSKKQQPSFVKTDPKDGYAERGRFGTAVSSLGDLDQDGYEDIAVGAPYEGQGAVYIYNGSPSGLQKDYSQRISAAEFSPYMMGFGIAFSKPADIDNNHYADVAVGSYLSESVTLLRSHPVVKLRMLLTSKSTYLLLSDINFTFELYLWFEGQHVEEIDVNYTVTVDEKNKRGYFTPEQEKTNSYQYLVSLKNGTNHTREIEVTLDGKNRGQYIKEPIEVVMAADLKTNKSEAEDKNGHDFKKLYPIIHNYDSAKSCTLQVPLTSECGDKICVSDLIVTAHLEPLSQGVFVTGSSDVLDLKIYVENNGDPAYLTKACITLPSSVQLNNIPQNCFEPQTSSMFNGINITCDIAYLITSGMKIPLTVHLDMTTVTHDFNLTIGVSSAIKDFNETNNFVEVTVKVVTEADVMIAGKDEKGDYVYDGQYPENSIFHHKYEVQKFKQSSVDEVEVILNVPWLLHVEGLPGPIKLVDVYEPEAIQNDKNSNEMLSCESDIPFQDHTLDETSEIRGTNRSTNNSMIENPQATQAPTTISLDSHLYLNCSSMMSNIECGYIRCLTRPFTNNHTIARITLTMKINITDLVQYLGKNGVIVYSTDGSVNITKPAILNASNSLTDYASVSTTFYLYAPREKVKLHVYILAIVGGLLLLLLLVLGLVKAGFFRRKKKEEMQNLIAQNEGTSSNVEDKCGNHVAVNEG